MRSESGKWSNNSDAAETGKKGSKKTARFDLPPPTSTNSGAGDISGAGGEYVEITLEVANDSSVQLLEARPSSPPAKTWPGNQALRPSRNASARLREVSRELRRMASSLARRQPSTRRLDRSKPVGTALALKGLRFIATKTGGKDEWPEASRKFDNLTKSTKGLLDASQFAKCIDAFEKSAEFAKELFYALARREHIKGDFINKAQFQDFWMDMVDESFDSRLQIFFAMLDKDDDGRITKEEVVEILTLTASTNRLSGIKKKAGEFSDLIMEELDPDNSGYIMIETLKTLLLEAPREAARTDNSVLMSQSLSQMLKPTRQETLMKKWYGKAKYFMIDHWKRVWIIVLWLSVCATLFVYKFVQYKNNKDPFAVMGYCLCVAKGAAETLKLNMALILLPVCRNTITWLRNRTRLGVAVPFDDNFTFHQMIAVGIMVGVALHAGAHLTCDFPEILAASEESYEEHLAKYFGREQPESYEWFLKDWEGVTGIMMVVLMAVAFTLASPWLRTNKHSPRAPPKAVPETLLTKTLQKVKTPLVTKTLQRVKTPLTKILQKVTGFNAFWYSHHTFVIVYALLLVHGFKLYLTKDTWQKTTWMYIAVPITLYACERLTRALRSGIKPVTIQTAVLYEGNVLTLQMSKPQGFKYKSGQYMFLNCPAVSPFEWHPFSITSSPAEEHLSVHIRGLGDWTRQIQKVFSAACHPPIDGQSGLRRADGNSTSLPKILIDGAYGAPAQEYIDYDVVLLIGLGIGATPMISIIKDIVLNNINYKTTDDQETGQQTLANATSPPKKINTNNHNDVVLKTKKAYFYWVAPEQGTFDWFKEIMDEVAEVDRKGVIEMHNHCSSVYEEGDARSALITMLQTIYHAKNGTDVVAGTRVKSHFAKPVWREVYERIAGHHPDTTVGVFYCGMPALIKELKNLASDFSQKTSTKFEFHNEKF